LGITVNGVLAQLPQDPRVSLLDLLRDHLQLVGTKKDYHQGACGACTVLVDGERILPCLALAVQYEARSITSIKGLASDGTLHPLQEAFMEHDGFQCGYCTPGQICSARECCRKLSAACPVTSRDHEPEPVRVSVPAHMDVPQIDVMWTDIQDPHSPMGAHGIGEVGITAVGAAIANALYNPIGNRIRDFPITLDKLLSSTPINSRNAAAPSFGA
jgi:aerobic-type carbon monoxide dehydrogenase small subunit (CoxS/CutS family)